MKLKVNRYTITVTPEGPVDEAYIEDVIGLKNDGDTVELRRVDAMGLRRIAYLEAHARRAPLPIVGGS